MIQIWYFFTDLKKPPQKTAQNRIQQLLHVFYSFEHFLLLVVHICPSGNLN